MTQEDIKHIERVCGEDYSLSDIPAYLRQEDEEKRIRAEEALIEELIEERKNYNQALRDWERAANNVIEDLIEEREDYNQELEDCKRAVNTVIGHN